tara:strand:- start:2013 stop:2369 length:357 start_codon:yes stop_codon:yes gene_type:complete
LVRDEFRVLYILILKRFLGDTVRIPGLAIKKKVVCGVVYNPILEELYTAVLGKGALLNGKEIHVSTCDSLQKAIVSTNVGYDRTEEGIKFMTDNMARILRCNVRSMRSLGMWRISFGT